MLHENLTWYENNNNNNTIIIINNNVNARVA